MEQFRAYLVWDPHREVTNTAHVGCGEAGLPSRAQASSFMQNTRQLSFPPPNISVTSPVMCFRGRTSSHNDHTSHPTGSLCTDETWDLGACLQIQENDTPTTVTIHRTMSPSAELLLVSLPPWGLSWQGTALLPSFPGLTLQIC